MSGDLAILGIAALCLLVASAAGAFACGAISAVAGLRRMQARSISFEMRVPADVIPAPRGIDSLIKRRHS